jgi:hypothetical protein
MIAGKPRACKVGPGGGVNEASGRSELGERGMVADCSVNPKKPKDLPYTPESISTRAIQDQIHRQRASLCSCISVQVSSAIRTLSRASLNFFVRSIKGSQERASPSLLPKAPSPVD